MGATGATSQFLHCIYHRFESIAGIFAIKKSLIIQYHELTRRFIVDTPQAGHEGLCPGKQECAAEPVDSLTSADLT